MNIPATLDTAPTKEITRIWSMMDLNAKQNKHTNSQTTVADGDEICSFTMRKRGIMLIRIRIRLNPETVALEDFSTQSGK